MDIVGVDKTKSGLPMSHSSVPAKTRSGGMSAGFPRGAPSSTHRAIFATSLVAQGRIALEALDDRRASRWNHGGMTPGLSRRAVRCLMLRAHGRTSS